MTSTTFRIVFALFLIAHGWIHMSLAQVPVPQPGALRTPFMPAWWRDALDPAWPASHLGLPSATVQTLGWVLWVLIVAGYGVAGVALLIAPQQTALWQGFAAVASMLSLLLLGLYWHPWLPVGVLIDLGLLVGVVMRLPLLHFK